MKRSTLIGITLALITIEIAYTVAHLNEMHHFFDGVLQKKYYVLFAVSYIGFSLFSIAYYMFSVPSIEHKNAIQEYFKEKYGEDKYSWFYTYHFFIFAAASFYGNAWPYFIMSSLLCVLWSWVRTKQNDYAQEYELKRKKEEAKQKPTVVLDNNFLE